MMQKVILWDLDGTLVDPADAITGGMADAIEAHGFTRPSDETMRKFVGPPSMYCLEHFTDIPEENRLDVLAAYRAGYREHGIAKSKVYPGLKNLLGRLHQAGVKNAVATQKNLIMGRKVLETFDLIEFFDVVSGSPDELGSGDQNLPKDKPGIMAKALEDLGVVPGQDAVAVMVGDRIYDADGAKANRMPSIGVEWGYGTEQELSEEFDHRVKDSHDLRNLLSRILDVDL